MSSRRFTYFLQTLSCVLLVVVFTGHGTSALGLFAVERNCIRDEYGVYRHFASSDRIPLSMSPHAPGWRKISLPSRRKFGVSRAVSRCTHVSHHSFSGQAVP
jgi:hypothetical protein